MVCLRLGEAVQWITRLRAWQFDRMTNKVRIGALQYACLGVLGIGATTMVETARAQDRPVVHLKCTLSESTAPYDADFTRQFCSTLREALGRDLDATFQLVAEDAWNVEGKALLVDVRVASPIKASVRTSYGQVANGIFTAGSQSETTLNTVDSPLRPASSRALVMGIGRQMGLVR